MYDHMRASTNLGANLHTPPNQPQPFLHTKEAKATLLLLEFTNRLWIKAASFIDHTNNEIVLFLGEFNDDTIHPSVFGNVEEKFAHNLKEQSTQVSIDHTNALLCVDHNLQSMPLLHLRL